MKMITCKEATRMISMKEEGKLSFSERLKLWRHLAICTACRLFSMQTKLISKNFSRLPHHTHSSLSEEDKQNMITALKKSV